MASMHLTIKGLNARIEGLQKPATNIFQSKLSCRHIQHEIE